MELVKGTTLEGKHFKGRAEVLQIDEAANTIKMRCVLKNDTGFTTWDEEWNLQHTQWGIEQGEYRSSKHTGYPPTVKQLVEKFQQKAQMHQDITNGMSFKEVEKKYKVKFVTPL